MICTDPMQFVCECTVGLFVWLTLRIVIEYGMEAGAGIANRMRCDGRSKALVSCEGIQNFVSVLLLGRPKLRDGNLKFRGSLDLQAQARIAVDVGCNICTCLVTRVCRRKGSALSGAL